MTCDDIQAELTARAHDARDPGLDEAVDAHLGTCPACAGWDETMTPVRDVFRDARRREIDPPAFGFDRLRERIDAERARSALRARHLRLTFAGAAAAALLIAVAVGAFSTGEPAEANGPADLPDSANSTGANSTGVDSTGAFAGAGVAYGDVDRAGGTLANAGDVPARVDLAGGTGLVLAPSTLLRPLPDGRVSLERGRLYVRTSRPLALACGDVEVAVLGTAFAVERAGARVEVHVAEGRVELRSKAGALLLDPGTAGHADGASTPVGPRAASPWDALDWLGRPRLSLRSIDAGPHRIGFEIALRTDAIEPRPIRPFSATSPDFVVTITDPHGRTRQTTIQAKMLAGAPDDDAAGRHWLDRDHPYVLRGAFEATDLGSQPGTYTMVASYSVPETAGTDVLQGRFESEPIAVER